MSGFDFGNDANSNGGADFFSSFSDNSATEGASFFDLDPYANSNNDFGSEWQQQANPDQPHSNEEEERKDEQNNNEPEQNMNEVQSQNNAVEEKKEEEKKEENTFSFGNELDEADKVFDSLTPEPQGTHVQEDEIKVEEEKKEENTFSFGNELDEADKLFDSITPEPQGTQVQGEEEKKDDEIKAEEEKKEEEKKEDNTFSFGSELDEADKLFDSLTPEPQEIQVQKEEDKKEGEIKIEEDEKKEEEKKENTFSFGNELNEADKLFDSLTPEPQEIQVQKEDEIKVEEEKKEEEKKEENTFSFGNELDEADKVFDSLTPEPQGSQVQKEDEIKVEEEKKEEEKKEENTFSFGSELDEADKLFDSLTPEPQEIQVQKEDETKVDEEKKKEEEEKEENTFSFGNELDEADKLFDSLSSEPVPESESQLNESSISAPTNEDLSSIEDFDKLFDSFSDIGPLEPEQPLLHTQEPVEPAKPPKPQQSTRPQLFAMPPPIPQMDQGITPKPHHPSHGAHVSHVPPAIPGASMFTPGQKPPQGSSSSIFAGKGPAKANMFVPTPAVPATSQVPQEDTSTQQKSASSLFVGKSIPASSSQQHNHAATVPVSSPAKSASSKFMMPMIPSYAPQQQQQQSTVQQTPIPVSSPAKSASSKFMMPAIPSYAPQQQQQSNTQQTPMPVSSPAKSASSKFMMPAVPSYAPQQQQQQSNAQQTPMPVSSPAKNASSKFMMPVIPSEAGNVAPSPSKQGPSHNQMMAPVMPTAAASTVPTKNFSQNFLVPAPKSPQVTVPSNKKQQQFGFMPVMPSFSSQQHKPMQPQVQSQQHQQLDVSGGIDMGEDTSAEEHHSASQKFVVPVPVPEFGTKEPEEQDSDEDITTQEEDDEKGEEKENEKVSEEENENEEEPPSTIPEEGEEKESGENFIDGEKEDDNIKSEENEDEERKEEEENEEKEEKEEKKPDENVDAQSPAQKLILPAQTTQISLQPRTPGKKKQPAFMMPAIPKQSVSSFIPLSNAPVESSFTPLQPMQPIPDNGHEQKDDVEEEHVKMNEEVAAPSSEEGEQSERSASVPTFTSPASKFMVPGLAPAAKPPQHRQAHRYPSTQFMIPGAHTAMAPAPVQQPSLQPQMTPMMPTSPVMVGMGQPQQDYVQQTPQQSPIATFASHQQVHQMPQLSESDIEDRIRSRPSHPVASFGFGGRLAVAWPQRFYGHQQCVCLYSSRKVLAETVQAKQIAEFAGPLARGVSVDKVSDYASKQAAVAMSNAGAPNESISKALLWDLIALLNKSYGNIKPDSNGGGGGGGAGSGAGDAGSVAVKSTVLDLLSKYIEISKGGSYAAGTSGNVTGEAFAMSPSEGGNDRVKAFNDLVSSGRRKEGLELAISSNFWAHALIIAQQISWRDYFDTVAQFARAALVDGDPLKTLYLVGSQHAQDLFGETASLTCVLNNWMENIKVMLSNEIPKSSQLVGQFGDKLWLSQSNVAAAHFCYILVDHAFAQLGNPNARLILVGGDHKRHLYDSNFINIETLQMTEAYEYSKTKSNPQYCLLQFQPYKLIYARIAADCGFVDDALKYAGAITSVTKSRQQDMNPLFVRMLSDFEDRVKKHKTMTFTYGSSSSSSSSSIWNIFGLWGSSKASKGTETPVVSSSSTTSAIPPSTSPSGLDGLTVAPTVSPVPAPATSPSLHQQSLPPPQSPSSQPAKPEPSHSASNSSGGSGGGGGFFSKFFKKKNIILPEEENSFYYDEKLKKWVSKDANSSDENAGPTGAQALAQLSAKLSTNPTPATTPTGVSPAPSPFVTKSPSSSLQPQAAPAASAGGSGMQDLVTPKRRGGKRYIDPMTNKPHQTGFNPSITGSVSITPSISPMNSAQGTSPVPMRGGPGGASKFFVPGGGGGGGVSESFVPLNAQVEMPSADESDDGTNGKQQRQQQQQQQQQKGSKNEGKRNKRRKR